MYYDEKTKHYVPAMQTFEQHVPKFEKRLRENPPPVAAYLNGIDGKEFREFATMCLALFCSHDQCTIDTYSRIQAFKFQLFDWLVINRGEI